ncbi:MAG: type I polyketide synthase [Ancalomicrobiaceae bacterium]|nr:type I polyketide synthase [Ancalomicrobiaceae bacterium]
MSLATDTIAIVGAACRLPGAKDEKSFAELLANRLCSVRPFPDNRWNIARLYHPSATELGFSYSFAGGYLDDPFAFDPAAFGLSPREATQMDPQQRLLIELVWEALENARIPPSSLAGQEVGVYVGASSLDHSNIHAADPASIDSYFMTGNTLSVVANRVSYVFDFRGPSFTVDTACSSSLVAMAQAYRDLLTGRIDTAIVAGVNVLLSPFSFVGFSRASMLSPTGLCRSFSAAGDGYVRSEGGVALVIRRADLARPGSIRAYIEATKVNSDGRTSGIALPGLDGQVSLLGRLYAEAGIEPERIAFVEAHGTGTRVGDPIEAEALGRVLGQRRSRPLPIGSVKSNIGHLEPASGVAGIMKALIAFETRTLPASLHLDEFNPLIDFERLNLAPAREPVALDRDAETLICGVSAFGFGGTNAHVVLRSAERPPSPADGAIPPVGYLMISAATREALKASVAAHADLIAEGADAASVAAAVASGRDRLKHRAVVAVVRRDEVGPALRAYVETGKSELVQEGTAPVRDAGICFVYSGNGAQWIGMGRAAFERNAAFRQRLNEIDAEFARIEDRSLVGDLFAPDLAERMRFGAFVQPLLFAMQEATTFALAASGIRPSVVLGHSIGELAAALTAGAISLSDALRIVRARSSCQEAVQGRGTMAVFAAGRDVVADCLAALGRHDIDIAADNGPSSVTVSGSFEAVALAVKLGRQRRIATRSLDIDYPFHSHFLDGLRQPMLESLGAIAPRPASIALVSTVTGEAVGDRLLDGEHWWLNVRAPVLFRQAIETAAGLGAQLFIEIGPQPILLSPMNETLKEIGANARVVASLAKSDDQDALADPIERAAARALANGAPPVALDASAIPVDRSLALPTYAWQRETLKFAHTSERLDVFAEEERHPLIGSRLAQGQHEWRTVLDARIVPYLADHVVDGEIVVPGSALAEMVLAAARDLAPAGAIGFEDFDILTPLVLPRDAMREISVRHAGDSGSIEIWSRPRLGPDEWSLNARGRLVPVSAPARTLPGPSGPLIRFSEEEIYRRASLAGLGYGPAFRLARTAERRGDLMDVVLAAPATGGSGLFRRDHYLHPTSLDAALHPLLCLSGFDPLIKKAYLPVRMARLVVYRDHATVVAAKLQLERERKESLTVSVWLIDAAGETVAEVSGLFLRSIVLARFDLDDVFFHVEMRRRDQAAGFDPAGIIAGALAGRPAGDLDDARLLLTAHMRTASHRALKCLAGADGRLDPAELVASGRLAADAVTYACLLAADLAAAQLAVPDGSGYVLAEETGLPDPELILSTVAAECPWASAELMLAAHTAAGLADFLKSGVPIAHRGPVLEQFEAMRLSEQGLRSAVDAALAAVIAATPDTPLRVVIAEPDCGGLLALVAPRVRRRQLSAVVAGSDAKRLEHLGARLLPGSGIDTLQIAAGVAAKPRFDLALVDAAGVELIADLLPWLSERSIVVVAQPPADPLVDFWMGASGAGPAAGRVASTGPSAPAAELTSRLSGLGLQAITHHALGPGDGSLFVGRVAPRTAAVPATKAFRILSAGDHPHPFVAAFAAAALRAGHCIVATADQHAGGRIDHVCFVPDGVGDDLDRTTAAIDLVRAAIADCVAAKPCAGLRIIVESGAEAARDPFAEALRAFARVALNEHPEVDVHFADIERGVDASDAARDLLAWLARPDDERELSLTPRGDFVPRVVGDLPPEAEPKQPAAAMQLDVPQRGAIESFRWRPKPRQAPAFGEIEVEVIATGLNFRDVMLAMGVLDDEIVDGGKAGAVYGLECSGRVAAVGPGVSGHAVGDLVFGFAADAFSTHVVAAAEAFKPIPPGWLPEMAASIPVAFFTAWYGLVEVARVAAGERVLVHGASGGVGLAALQIAKSRGALVIATVSTPDKRALVQLFGADAVYDSRSLAFAEQIRAEHGGVDVVINSLAGEAMRASIKCLKPFGRFIELGKRDYVDNTLLGLRPFRHNITYAGIDLDQLIDCRPDIVARGLQDLVAALSDGLLKPLPCRVFAADEIGEAFRLMQAAGHVGKILVKPPVLDRLPPTAARGEAFVPAPGVQLVVGGTGGFGLATALWLAERGATRIIVASRRGRLEPQADEAVASWRQSGVDFAVETVDVADFAQVEALIARVAERMGPISGVYLTAAVLDDALIDDLDADRLRRVLAPKILGASHLDRATRTQPIAHFVLFSSGAALFGNPGQAAYVAANGWLHGLARRRRAEGLPALAIGWGTIADVGMLTRAKSTARQLERMTGVSGLTSAEALHRLGEMLTQSRGSADPVVYCARFKRSASMRRLPILSAPAFAGLLVGIRDDDVQSDTDLKALVASMPDRDAVKFVGKLVAGEVARILRLSAAEVHLDSQLDELGLDSLMGLELRMRLEAKFGVELPLVAITSIKSLRDLAQRLVSSMRSADETGEKQLEPGDASLVAAHGGEIDAFASLAGEIEARRAAAQRTTG